VIEYEGYVLRVLDIVRNSDAKMTRGEVVRTCRGNRSILVAAIDEAVNAGLLSEKKEKTLSKPRVMIEITARGRQFYSRRIVKHGRINNEKIVAPIMAFNATFTDDDFLNIMNAPLNDSEAYAYATYAKSIGDVLVAKYAEYEVVSIEDFLRDTVPTYWADREKIDIVKMMYAAQHCTNPAYIVNVIEGDGKWRISASDYAIEQMRKIGDRWAYKRWAKEVYTTWRF